MDNELLKENKDIEIVILNMIYNMSYYLEKMKQLGINKDFWDLTEEELDLLNDTRCVNEM